MAEHSFKTFPHRRNPDGTFDSICPLCFSTVSTRQNEMELAGDEMKHNCLANYNSGLAPRSASLDYIAECLSVFNGALAAVSDQKE
jgi:uncharacterized protein YcgI (DUF1989 family)